MNRPRLQLLRNGWYPATLDRPVCAMTFHALDLYLELSHQSKLNMYDYYWALSHLMDSMQLEDIDVSPFSLDVAATC